jgi:hypothetical protein
MDKNRFWSNLVIGAGTVMVAFAIPHLIDDFLYQMSSALQTRKRNSLPSFFPRS